MQIYVRTGGAIRPLFGRVKVILELLFDFWWLKVLDF